jgi:hypothetical protein
MRDLSAELDQIPKDWPPAWRLLAAPPVCLLCGGRPVYQSVLLPYDSTEFGGVRTQQRVFRSRRCGPCVQRPDRDTHVEARLLQQVRAPWN